MTIKTKQPRVRGAVLFLHACRQAGSYAGQQLFLNAYSSEVAAVVKDCLAVGANDSGQIVVALGTGVIAFQPEYQPEYGKK